MERCESGNNLWVYRGSNIHFVEEGIEGRVKIVSIVYSDTFVDFDPREFVVTS